MFNSNPYSGHRFRYSLRDQIWENHSVCDTYIWLFYMVLLSVPVTRNDIGIHMHTQSSHLNRYPILFGNKNSFSVVCRFAMVAMVCECVYINTTYRGAYKKRIHEAIINLIQQWEMPPLFYSLHLYGCVCMCNWFGRSCFPLFCRCFFVINDIIVSHRCYSYIDA